MSALDVGLRVALAELARTPRLLLACDYDGTLAPISGDIWRAWPLPEAVTALRALASLPETTAAVISGRALRELAVMSRLPAEVHLVGSHGSEFDIGFLHALDEQARTMHRRLVNSLRRLVSDAPGVTLEIKPASVAVHVRQAEPTVATRVLHRVKAGPGKWDGLQVTAGDAVLELSVVRTDKGGALDALRHQSGATAALFIGDDISAEEVFARLTGPDLGVKVGAGQTIAPYRITGPGDVAAVLAFLSEERRAWLYGEQALPIERLSMLGNGRSVALVTPDARVCWHCFPGPAGTALFAELLGGTLAGYFAIRPRRDSLPLGQRYIPETMTVETRWSRMTVTDYLDHNTEPSRTDLVRVISGSAPALVEFAPRPEFGQVPVRLQPVDDGLLVVGTSDPIVLRAPGMTWEVVSDGRHETARALAEPSPDAPQVLELRCGTSDASPHPLPEPQRRRLSETHWSRWLGGLSLPRVETALVSRSALTLRALCNVDSGGILAAATTSLPEVIGGTRNWDYRHCWIRDAALTAGALVSLGSTAEAIAFLAWLRTVLAGLTEPEHLHPVYALDGSLLGPEAVIDTLPGYAGSRPVRIGNLAEQQVQIDVFGPVVELIHALTIRNGQLDEAHWSLVRAMCAAVARRWHQPDHGIWEERITPRHHIYSKVMCWVAIDRAIQLACDYGAAVDPTWPELRQAIAADVLEKGWDEQEQAFTAAYGSSDLDAASLHVGLSGMVDPGDHRFQSTVTAVEAELRSGSTVYRYRHDDGLPGQEGGLHLCTAWLIEAYLISRRHSEAQQLFEQMIDTVGPTGLLSEEYDPIAERALGNHPQAYSHIGIIRCAQMLERFSQLPIMHASEVPPDFSHLDDPAFLDERARVRRLLERQPQSVTGRARLERLYAALTEEFLDRARIAWRKPPDHARREAAAGDP